MIPYEVPVTQPGSAVHQKTSSGCRSSASAPVAWCATTASWTCTAPFGVPGRAAGEVQQRQRPRDRSAGSRSRPAAPPCSGSSVEHAVRRVRRVVADEQHVLEVGQPSRSAGDLAPVQRRRRHQHAPPRRAPGAGADRLGAERREQRAEDAAALERAERRDVELRDAAERARTRARPCRRRAPRRTLAKRLVARRELGVREVAALAVAAEPAQRAALAAAAPRRGGRPPRARCSGPRPPGSPSSARARAAQENARARAPRSRAGSA